MNRRLTGRKFGRGFFLFIITISLLAFYVSGCGGGGGGSSSSTDDPTGSPSSSPTATGGTGTYSIVDTNQTKFYGDVNEISEPAEGAKFYGQDASYSGLQPSYEDNGDGTVTDLNTGLMWVKDPGDKMTYDEAINGAGSCNAGGYTDWRTPSIKELYSLFLNDGVDPSIISGDDTSLLTAYIDTDFFDFEYGDTSTGDRIIDSQWVTTSIYTGTVFGGEEAFFGVNFADGRIKGYPTNAGKGYFVRYVRDNTQYGLNNFVDNGDGTITDNATGLTWQQGDSGEGMIWSDALDYAENLELAGHNDWRLPNMKELQSIVDYSRSPDYTNSAAIDPLFTCTQITNEGGEADYAFYWTGSTHVNYPNNGSDAAYVAFGRGLGYWEGSWMDVHGAGCQRSDPKTGDPADYPTGHGPQGDAIRIYNFVRGVRGGTN